MHLTQSLRTDDSNKTRWFSQHNTKATHTFYSFQCFLSLKSRQLIITFRFSVCLSLHQTSIFTSFHSTLFTTVELQYSSFFMHLRKYFSFAIKFSVYWHFSLFLLLFFCIIWCWVFFLINKVTHSWDVMSFYFKKF